MDLVDATFTHQNTSRSLGAVRGVQWTLSIESLYDAVHTYTRKILSRSLVSFFVWHRFVKIWHFNRVYISIFLSLGRNLVLCY